MSARSWRRGRNGFGCRRTVAEKGNAPPFPDGAVTSKSVSAYTLNEDPQPQVLLTLGLSNLKPAPSKVSM